MKSEYKIINKDWGDMAKKAIGDTAYDEEGITMPKRLIKHGEKYEYAIIYFDIKIDDYGQKLMTSHAIVGHTLKAVVDEYLKKTGRIIEAFEL